MVAAWNITPAADKNAHWSATANVNAVSDRYMLRDFFLNECQTCDKPDNTVRLTHTTQLTQGMLYTRFAPNNYYATDERMEGSFYRVRTPIFDTRINYETRTGAGVMHQYISPSSAPRTRRRSTTSGWGRSASTTPACCKRTPTHAPSRCTSSPPASSCCAS